MTKGMEDTGEHDIVDLDAVVQTVRQEVRPTAFVQSDGLDAALGAKVLLAVECFQHTGSFKYRAALAVALNSPSQHLIAASSGNFGAALARAAVRTSKRCTIVMPVGSSEVKVDAVRTLGAEVELVDTRDKTRAQRVRELQDQYPTAQPVSAYDEPFVIAGNASLGVEIFERGVPQAVLVPVGGGGLSSGIVKSRDKLSVACPVWGAEPLLANDAARSLRAGVICRADRESDTICDGARTLSLGQRNFAILRRGLAGIVEITEDAVARAVRLLFLHANLKVEPTGALAVAALLMDPARLAGQRVVCVVSGGNVDPELYASLILA